MTEEPKKCNFLIKSRESEEVIRSWKLIGYCVRKNANVIAEICESCEIKNEQEPEKSLCSFCNEVSIEKICDFEHLKHCHQRPKEIQSIKRCKICKEFEDCKDTEMQSGIHGLCDEFDPEYGLYCPICYRGYKIQRKDYLRHLKKCMDILKAKKRNMRKIVQLDAFIK